MVGLLEQAQGAVARVADHQIRQPIARDIASDDRCWSDADGDGGQEAGWEGIGAIASPSLSSTVRLLPARSTVTRSARPSPSDRSRQRARLGHWPGAPGRRQRAEYDIGGVVPEEIAPRRRAAVRWLRTRTATRPIFRGPAGRSAESSANDGQSTFRGGCAVERHQRAVASRQRKPQPESEIRESSPRLATTCGTTRRSGGVFSGSLQRSCRARRWAGARASS